MNKEYKKYLKYCAGYNKKRYKGFLQRKKKIDKYIQNAK